MTEQTVTREQIKEVLINDKFGLITIDRILNELFPPPFTPKPGQVVMITDPDGKDIRPQGKVGNGSSGENGQWSHCRPLTEEEINGREE